MRQWQILKKSYTVTLYYTTTHARVEENCVRIPANSRVQRSSSSHTTRLVLWAKSLSPPLCVCVCFPRSKRALLLAHRHDVEGVPQIIPSVEQYSIEKWPPTLAICCRRNRTGENEGLLRFDGFFFSGAQDLYLLCKGKKIVATTGGSSMLYLVVGTLPIYIL